MHILILLWLYTVILKIALWPFLTAVDVDKLSVNTANGRPTEKTRQFGFVTGVHRRLTWGCMTTFSKGKGSDWLSLFLLDRLIKQKEVFLPFWTTSLPLWWRTRKQRTAVFRGRQRAASLAVLRVEKG